MASRSTTRRKTGGQLSKLNDQQKLFILYYLGEAHLNGTQAAKMAGYAAPSVSANKLLKNPHIGAEVARRLKEREDKLEVTAERVIQELAAIAFLDFADYTDENGQLDISNLRAIPEHARRALASLKIKRKYSTDSEGEITPEDEIEFRTSAKLGALELLMKHLGMFAAEKKEVKTTLDWDPLLDPTNDAPENDPIERRIIEAESRRIE